MSAPTMRFSELPVDERLLRTLEAMGFREPRPIQAAVVPVAIGGGHVLALAPTGTGKTVAYGLPLAARLLADRPPKGGRGLDPKRRLRALVLCPTRELAMQVGEELSSLVRGLVLRVAVATGKAAIRPQREAIAAGVDILVGTPGRVRELLEGDALSLAFLQQVVIDEADRMLDFGFLPQVRWILERTAAEPQRMLFSATLPRGVERLAAEFLPDAARIELGERNAAAPHLAHRLIDTTDPAKVPLLLSLVEGRRGAVVFVRTRRRAGWVAEALRRHGMAVGVLHGDRTPAQRRAALEGFLAGRLAVLVATDVAARGLHLPGVGLVINYDLPLLPEEWVHRVGRAGHGGGAGESISLRTPEDAKRWLAIASIAGVAIAAERSGPSPAPPRGRGKAASGAVAKGTPKVSPRRRGESAVKAERKGGGTGAAERATRGRTASAAGGSRDSGKAKRSRRRRATGPPPRIGQGVRRPNAAAGDEAV